MRPIVVAVRFASDFFLPSIASCALPLCNSPRFTPGFPCLAVQVFVYILPSEIFDFL